MPTITQRALPIGAELTADGVHFRVWAPNHKTVEVVLDNGRAIRLAAESDGYFSAVVEQTGAGTRYQFRLGGASRLLPDPASRFQPEGPHGPSEVIDPHRFQWSDAGWAGISIKGQIMYEVHIGTFTAEGTWQAASAHLSELRDVGITALEIMPVACFPGEFGWGYDGVDLFAPTAQYGRPDDFRAFVDAAHASGLGVILDVVYNHLGPDGNYLNEFSTAYFSRRYQNEWGDPLNFDGTQSGPVREFFVANARYWIDEFHLDGLRLDATQQIFDASPQHVIKDIVQNARDAAQGRKIIIVAENETQQAQLAQPPEQGGFGIDALWNDDFHHTAQVAMSGRTEAYFSDYKGTPQEFISSLKRGYLYQGQYYRWQKKRRGSPTTGLPAAAFVNYLRNHDQIANSHCGLRLHQITSPGLLRAITAVLLLAPQTPLLFQGQDFAASAPFLYFADHHPELARLVRQGRETFLKQFPSIEQSEVSLSSPDDRTSFERCKLDHRERQKNADVVRLHRDLLALRKSDPVFKAQRSDCLDGAVLATSAFVIRFFGGHAGDRLMVVNLGFDLDLSPVPEPLLAEPPDQNWQLIWFSESPTYGGCGRFPLSNDGIWSLTSQSTAVFKSEKRL